MCVCVNLASDIFLFFSLLLLASFLFPLSSVSFPFPRSNVCMRGSTTVVHTCSPRILVYLFLLLFDLFPVQSPASLVYVGRSGWRLPFSSSHSPLLSFWAGSSIKRHESTSAREQVVSSKELLSAFEKYKTAREFGVGIVPTIKVCK